MKHTTTTSLVKHIYAACQSPSSNRNKQYSSRQQTGEMCVAQMLPLKDEKDVKPKTMAVKKSSEKRCQLVTGISLLSYHSLFEEYVMSGSIFA